ncbi:MAG: tRNA (adenosine(37)-N6)-dimethylallyltransferase MiaA [Candidatus Omnitrophica bacterium]|nr:tRNA (adenosine(37)-N6)-dimethylallyltransferase MiaA [Candidatus Omnitrophota bacterium]MDD5653787.1 tRNA (adenosine(37)-N6)-dimethylallyltransferase MiaA [Candidatus Omnitrophota bacterium]
MPKEKIIFIVGPTASGKSVVAVQLAKRIKGEIISCDSMQVYKMMPILTSQPTLGLRKQVKHHLIATVAPAIEYNVSQYRREALKKISQIQKKKKIPVFVGGTGLYMSVLLHGIFEQQEVNPKIRESLLKQAKKFGSVYLYRKLEKADPQAAAKIHPHDAKRIIRALEVFQATGKPISVLQKTRKGLNHDYEVKIFGLNLPREKLYTRIEERVDRMLEQGLEKEVKKLLKSKLSRTAQFAIGIKELAGYLHGEYGWEEAVRMMKQNTRHYAKRQLTWFRKEKAIQWINLTGKEKPQEVAVKLWKKLY